MIVFVWAVWAALLTTLFILMVYRGTLNIHQEDQLFLGDVAQQSYEYEVQQEVGRKMDKVQPFVKVFTGASAFATVVLVGYYVVNALGTISAR
jgi:hypothetical protein